MYQEINEQLVKVREAMNKKQKWEKQLTDYHRELTEIKDIITQLEIQLVSEKKDVKKLEKVGITNIVQTLFGSKHEKLKTEKQEVIAVQLKLEEAEKTKQEIYDSIDQLEQNILTVADVQDDYEYLKSLKAKRIIDHDTTFGDRLFELGEREGDLEAYLKELNEAIEAGQTVKQALQNAIKSLESASNWGTFDLFGGGMVSDIFKHDHIDEATEHIHDAQTKMRIFQKELIDIDDTATLEVDISGLLKFADFFFDGFIADWMVQGKIKDSLQQVKDQQHNVNSIIQELKEKVMMKEEELAVVKSDRNTLVENL